MRILNWEIVSFLTFKRFMETIIASIRRIEWSQMKMNFSVLFPKGALENAPQSNVITTQAPTVLLLLMHKLW